LKGVCVLHQQYTHSFFPLDLPYTCKSGLKKLREGGKIRGRRRGGAATGVDFHPKSLKKNSGRKWSGPLLHLEAERVTPARKAKKKGLGLPKEPSA